MTIFSDAAKSLGLSETDQAAVWVKLREIGVGPDDPECVRLLVSQQIESQIGKIRRVTIGAIAEFKKAQEQAESSSLATLSVKGAELAKSVADEITAAVDTAVRARSQEAAARANADYRVSVAGGVVCCLVMLAIGFYAGLLWHHWPTVITADWLRTWSPTSLLLTGAVGFIVVRLVIAWASDDTLIRFLLALPPIDKQNRWK